MTTPTPLAPPINHVFVDSENVHQVGMLSQPLLYLSLCLKQHRPVYCDLLDSVRTEGDWEAILNEGGEPLRAMR